jgi:ceramide glucosyltransferase
MTPLARHKHWIVADSEALIDAAFADAFRNEWIGSDAEVLTAGYRFAGTGELTQRLDAMSTILSLWPGLELVRAFGKINFTLGACTGFRRTDLEAIGGWESLADQLAEDYWLGAKFFAKSRTVRLSESILTLDSDRMGWSDYWRHQHRVAVTYRAVRPLGTAGMILTRGVTATLLLMCLQPIWGSILFSFALVSRIALAECIAAVRGFPLKHSAGLVILSDIVETVAWIRAWTARSVWWRGRWRRVGWSGRLQ